MDSETWLEKASRLHRLLAKRGERVQDDEQAARERIEVALWLRREFGDVERSEADVIPSVSAD